MNSLFEDLDAGVESPIGTCTHTQVQGQNLFVQGIVLL